VPPNDDNASAVASVLDIFDDNETRLPEVPGRADAEPWEALVDRPRPATPVYLDLNDTHLLVEVAPELPPALSQPGAAPPGSAAVVAALTQRVLQDGTPAITPADVDAALNLSNDKYYTEGRQKQTERVRYGANQLALKHTGPALRLEYPLVRLGSGARAQAARAGWLTAWRVRWPRCPACPPVSSVPT